MTKERHIVPEFHSSLSRTIFWQRVKMVVLYASRDCRSGYHPAIPSHELLFDYVPPSELLLL